MVASTLGLMTATSGLAAASVEAVDPPTVTAASPPSDVIGQPFVVQFSAPVQGITTANFTVNQTGFSTGIASRITCRGPAGVVSCASGPVTVAGLFPKKALIPGEYYFILVNEAAGGIVSFDDPSVSVPSSQTYVRGPSRIWVGAPGIISKWGVVEDARAAGGSYIQESRPGATASFRTEANSIAITTWNDPQGGRATVSVVTRGQPAIEQAIDTYAATPGSGTTVIPGVPGGTKTVTITIDNASNPLSGGSLVRLDAVTLDGSIVSTPRLTTQFGPGFIIVSFNVLTAAVSYTTGASVSSRFRGTAVTWSAFVGPQSGKVSVQVDGWPAVTVDLDAPTDGIQSFTTGGLSPWGFHRVKITSLGTKNPASSGFRVGIEQLSFDGI